MRNKHSSTVTGTDLRLSVSHSPTFHLPSLKTTGLSEISDIEVKKKKKSDYSGFITVHHKASFICSRKLWLNVKKTFSL